MLSGKVTNTDTSDHIISTIFKVTLPSDIASKIYRVDGTSCDSGTYTQARILWYSGQSGYTVGTFLVSSESANEITITESSSPSLSSGLSREFNLRVPLFLDIGTVQ